MGTGFQNSGLGLYKGAFNIGLYLFIFSGELSISPIFGSSGTAGKVSSCIRVHVKYPPLKMD